MDRTRGTVTNKRPKPREKLMEVSELQLNLFLRNLSAVLALVGVLYAALILVLQILGVLNLPAGQELALLVVPPLVGSALFGFLIRRARQERVKVRRNRKLANKTASRSVLDVPSDGYREFDVVLRSAGRDKLPVIREIRAATGLGLKEAKALVDDVPYTIKNASSKEAAEALKSRLERAGAEIELR